MARRERAGSEGTFQPLGSVRFAPGSELMVSFLPLSLAPRGWCSHPRPGAGAGHLQPPALVKRGGRAAGRELAAPQARSGSRSPDSLISEPRTREPPAGRGGV